MIRHSLIAFALIASQPALGQAWQHPNWTDGTVPEQTWSRTPTVGNGVADASATVTQGGTPPAVAYEPAIVDEVGYVRADWLLTTGSQRPDLGEHKFRLVCHDVGTGRFDPILFPNISEAGHDHTFIGNKSPPIALDYAAIRAAPAGTCPGGPLNTVTYWRPSTLKALASGVVAEMRGDAELFYYTHLPSQSPKKTRQFRALAFIGGRNPADFNHMTEKARIDAANTAMGLTGSAQLEYPDQGRFGFHGWACFAPGATVQAGHGVPLPGGESTSFAKYLRGPAGQDPWGGTCTAGSEIAPQVLSPDCWDGHNLSSPDGRGHVAYSTRTKDNMYTDICPDGWWHLPTFQAKPVFTHNGPSDYMNWYLSSDRMNPANTPGDPTSADECRQTGPWFCNGATMHFDWANTGWDQRIFNLAMAKCLGMTLPEYMAGDTSLTPDGATCETNTIADNMVLKTGAPPVAGLSDNPIVSVGPRYNLPNNQRFFPLKPGRNIGDVTIDHVH